MLILHFFYLQTTTLILFLVKNGNERVVEECRDHLHTLRPLQDYNFYEGANDKGSGVRELTKSIVELLSSNEMIRSEREKARQLRHKFTGVGNSGSSGLGNNSDPYGGSGSNDSYGNRGIDSDSRNSGRRDSYRDSERSGDRSERRGGGAYDSDRPNRFDDNASDRDRDSNEDLDYASRMKAKKAAQASTASTSNPKLKVSIKSAGTSSLTKVGKKAAPVEDLLVADEPSSDPFGMQSAPQVSANFDNFGYLQ